MFVWTSMKHWRSAALKEAWDFPAQMSSKTNNENHTCKFPILLTATEIHYNQILCKHSEFCFTVLGESTSRLSIHTQQGLIHISGIGKRIIKRLIKDKCPFPKSYKSPQSYFSGCTSGFFLSLLVTYSDRFEGNYSVSFYIRSSAVK